MRPAWTSVPGDDWREVTDIAAAARLLPEIGSCAFLSIGRQELAVFADVPGVSFVARSLDPPDGDNALPGATWLTGRGPFTMEQETTLLRDHGIDVVVSKNAGGDATYAKIAAARELGIPVWFLARRPDDGTGAAGQKSLEKFQIHDSVERIVLAAVNFASSHPNR